MFTGIIQTIGKIKSIKAGAFCFEAQSSFFNEVKIGDSIAVNGVCLTAIEIGNDYFKANISQETLRCTIFNHLGTNNLVNLEKALRLNQGIDGHLVSGHVDGIAKVVDRFIEGESTRFKINTPRNLIKYIAKKGSVCINGVSLTVNDINDYVFDINIVPHTLKATTLGELEINSEVNLEGDIIARHLEQLLQY
ncbi:riboflavin synthase alpha chain [Abyssogena phaseoliformis symbiont OG214]|uniref:riboflavin synthase n=1 Tax=Abyssogena phaseoliformis symbiont TaxID=596095 RepID=UPI0019161967|nr:riboflavin synthase [Abyssogena phaseoliformis symbiont]MBW5289217.1 Riboflavin synthase eubacterial/eukaryotic [Candidatus Ruthia sp. Apha_13_S6]BBB22754.1 riboflavin synthase alpha chain [Abyssogena phaseoliformis symbiont OG214]